MKLRKLLKVDKKAHLSKIRVGAYKRYLSVIEFSDLKIIIISFGVSALQTTDLFIPENCFTSYSQITHVLVFWAETVNMVDSHAESCQISLQISPH